MTAHFGFWIKQASSLAVLPKNYLIDGISATISRLSLIVILLCQITGCTFSLSPGQTEQASREFVSITSRTLVQQGIEKSERGDSSGAITDFTEALKINPNNADAYYNQAVVYSQLGNFELAIANFSQALKLDPNLVQAYVNRGSIYSHLGNNEKAIADLTKALKINPNDAFGHNNLGVVFLRSGDSSRAVANLTEALKINPNYAEAYLNRGLAHSDLGDSQGAVADFEKAADLFWQQGKREAYQYVSSLRVREKDYGKLIKNKE